jgi:hypothetical protein
MTTGRGTRSLHIDQLTRLETRDMNINQDIDMNKKTIINLEDPYDPPNDTDVASVGFVKRTCALSNPSSTQLLYSSGVYGKNDRGKNVIRFFSSGIISPVSCIVSKLGISLQQDTKRKYTINYNLNDQNYTIGDVSLSGSMPLLPKINFMENDKLFFDFEYDDDGDDDDINDSSSLTLFVHLLST